MLDKPILYLKLIGYIAWVIYSELSRMLRVKWIHHQVRGQPPVPRDRNIVIVGASFAGNRAAELLTSCLPPNSRYRVVVIEPNSHFQFTWVLPRMCVVKNHEHKAFIPYRGNVFDKPEGVLRWVSDRVEHVTETSVHLRDSREEIPYEILILATGSDVKQGLPSRVNATDKRNGIELLRAVQNSIAEANTVVVVGGGAAGVEIATDAKDLYPNKNIILVHSRTAVMHRFGTALQTSAQMALDSLGVEVILGERVTEHPAKPGTVLLTSGREIQCDLVVRTMLSSGTLRRIRADVCLQS
jgi:NADH dehydrogenase FAD-containing subunit